MIQTEGARESDAAVGAIDSITFEIVRHRLWAIADEMAMTLIKTAGNPTISEVNDFMVAIFTPEGEIALGGWGGNRHVSCTAQACKGILARFPADQIHEDDVFLLNDPYVAAIHQQDVYVLSPVHFEGELIGWVGNFTHMADIGGIDPGWSARATDVRQEGLRIPGLKISDRGELRKDVWDTLLNMTREPEMDALQLKAQMAANNVGKQKLRGLLAKVGLAQYRTIVAQMMAHSEQALRSRLRTLPDGTWRTREYFDTKDRIFKVQLAMTKRGDELEFDFTGTSEQANSFINCTYWGTRGGIFVALSTMLAHGLTWNEGLLKPLRIVIPEGTLLNASFPAPVSMGTLAASRLATVASWSTIASMLAMSTELHDEYSALWSCSSAGMNVSGVGRDNRYFVATPHADAGGAGARPFADGVDTAHGFSNPVVSILNVETIERNAPVLYLFRRQQPDSAGPGMYRGGVGTEAAFTVHKAPQDALHGVMYVSGLEPALTHGTQGGLPGCNTLFELREGSRVREVLTSGAPLELDQLGGEVRRLPPQGLYELQAGTVFHGRADGGGGLGDPLLRDPARTLADVRAGLVSPEQARALYGVVLTASGDAVDVDGTTRLRERLRRARLGPQESQPAEVNGSTNGAPGDKADRHFSVRYDHERGIVCCAGCGGDLGSTQANWKASVLTREQPLAEIGPLMSSTRFVLRSFVCPRCGLQLDAEMTLPEDPPVMTYSPLGSA
jgi:N-methylhydantoinase B